MKPLIRFVCTGCGKTAGAIRRDDQKRLVVDHIERNELYRISGPALRVAEAPPRVTETRTRVLPQDPRVTRRLARAQIKATGDPDGDLYVILRSGVINFLCPKAHGSQVVIDDLVEELEAAERTGRARTVRLHPVQPPT